MTRSPATAPQLSALLAKLAEELAKPKAAGQPDEARADLENVLRMTQVGWLAYSSSRLGMSSVRMHRLWPVLRS